MSNNLPILPEYISSFLKISPVFFNLSAESYSGREVRQVFLVEPRYNYSLSSFVLSKSMFLKFNEFFTARHGSYFPFCIKNFLDYKITNLEITLVAPEKKFLLNKQYIINQKKLFVKKITNPIMDSIKISYNNQNLNFHFDHYTSYIQILDDVPQGSKLYLNCEFYYQVRFRHDSFEYNFLPDNLVKISEIELLQAPLQD